MDGRIDMILDGDEVGIGLESTIIDVTSEVPALLRPGFISEDMLREVLGRMEVDAVSMGPMAADSHPKAPGMKYRHYAPRADMTILRGEAGEVENRICSLVKQALAEGKRVGVICTQESQPVYRERLTVRAGCLDLAVIGTRFDPSTIAHNLFDVLRSFDDAGVDVIFSESFEEGQLGGAIMNRLKKAAGYHIVDV